MTVFPPSRRGTINRGLQTALPDGCGQLAHSSTHLIDNFAKIVGGSTLEPSEDPWLVSLQLREDVSLIPVSASLTVLVDFTVHFNGGQTELWVSVLDKFWAPSVPLSIVSYDYRMYGKILVLYPLPLCVVPSLLVCPSKID